MKKDTKDTLRTVFIKVKNFVQTLFFLAFLACVWLIYSNYYQKYSSTPADSFSTSDWDCLGKTTCSEMDSCEEAKFYMRNCPDTDLDPDGDGMPCERSVCAND